jgi:hypothetical protein
MSRRQINATFTVRDEQRQKEYVARKLQNPKIRRWVTAIKAAPLGAARHPKC